MLQNKGAESRFPVARCCKKISAALCCFDSNFCGKCFTMNQTFGGASLKISFWFRLILRLYADFPGFTVDLDQVGFMARIESVRMFQLFCSERKS